MTLAGALDEAADVMAICASNWRSFLRGPYPEDLTDHSLVVLICHKAIVAAGEEWSSGVGGYSDMCAIAECLLRTSTAKWVVSK